jgi:hypothetical protein
VSDVIIDSLVVLFSLVYYAFLCVVYLLRSYQKDKAELRLALIFSLLLVPFILLWVLNIYIRSDVERLISGFLIIVYLIYDLWYRLLTKKKPVHHPNHWPMGLIIYLILLQVGSIGLNWYGYLVLRIYGNILVISYFVMLGCFGFYQTKYNRWKKIKNVGEGI